MSKSTISTFELFQMFPDQESARVYFEARRWPDGATCPACERGEDFLVARVSPDAKVVGVEHATSADWHVVKAAHVALRDYLSARIANAGKCPAALREPSDG